MVRPSVPQRMSIKLRLCISFAQVLLQIALLLLIIFLCRIPNSPKFKVESVITTTPFTLQQIHTTTTTQKALSVGLNITFWIGNPNHGTLYKEANVSVYYRKRFLISTTYVHSLCPDHPTCDNSILNSFLPVTIKASSVPILDNFTALSLASDLEYGQVSVVIKVRADYRWYDHFLAALNATCNNINIGVPAGIMVGGSRPCKVFWSVIYLKTDMLFFLVPLLILNALILLYWWIG